MDLESYFNTPEEWRAAFSMLKGNGFVPPEVEMLKKAAGLEGALASCGDPRERVKMRREIDELRTAFRMAGERLKKG